jgi:hypothetical protein
MERRENHGRPFQREDMMRGILVVTLLCVGVAGLLFQAIKENMLRQIDMIHRLEKRPMWSPFGKPAILPIHFQSAETFDPSSIVEPDVGVSPSHSKYV